MNKAELTKLVKEYQRLIYKIASNYTQSGVSLEDLIQECTIGFIKAAKNYKSNKGASLKTYAVWCMKGHTSRASRVLARSIRLPEHIYLQSNEYEKLKKELEVSLKREPTDEEIIEKSETIKLKNIEVLKSLHKLIPLSFETKVEGTDYTVADGLADTLSEETDMLDSLFYKELWKYLNRLDPKYLFVLIRRYDLKSEGTKYTYKELGSTLNCSVERVRQIEQTALRKLKRMIEYSKEDS